MQEGRKYRLFDFTVLLHEVVHRAVLTQSDDRAYRVLGLLYAIPSGISASQFTRWHLDHHAGLGSYEDDPKLLLPYQGRIPRRERRRPVPPEFYAPSLYETPSRGYSRAA